MPSTARNRCSPIDAPNINTPYPYVRPSLFVSRTMYDWATAGALLLGSIVGLYLGQRALWHRTSYPLPPGPPGLPWVGNVIGINASTPWITHTDWARTYGASKHVPSSTQANINNLAGDVVYSRLLGKDIIILNSEKVAKDLLENRSKNYSDRPYLITWDLLGPLFLSCF